MSKFTTWLRNSLEAIKEAEIKEPDSEVKEGEEVVGVLTDPDVRRYYALSSRLADEAKLVVEEVAHGVVSELFTGDAENRLDHDPATCKRCAARRHLATFADNHETINSLFWTALRHELSEEARIKLDKAQGGIGIRKGWQIVAIKEETPRIKLAGVQVLGPFPGGLFGG